MSFPAVTKSICRLAAIIVVAFLLAVVIATPVFAMSGSAAQRTGAVTDKALAAATGSTGVTSQLNRFFHTQKAVSGEQDFTHQALKKPHHNNVGDDNQQCPPAGC